MSFANSNKSSAQNALTLVNVLSRHSSSLLDFDIHRMVILHEHAIVGTLRDGHGDATVYRLVVEVGYITSMKWYTCPANHTDFFGEWTRSPTRVMWASCISYTVIGVLGLEFTLATIVRLHFAAFPC